MLIKEVFLPNLLFHLSQFIFSFWESYFYNKVIIKKFKRLKFPKLTSSNLKLPINQFKSYGKQKNRQYFDS